MSLASFMKLALMNLLLAMGGVALLVIGGLAFIFSNGNIFYLIFGFASIILAIILFIASQYYHIKAKRHVPHKIEA